MHFEEYIEENMVFISGGQEIIRDFVDPVKWLSSDYKMSVPGTNKEKIVRQELVTVQSFLLLRTPVTNELYDCIMGMDNDTRTKDFPVVNVTRIDAIRFCNMLAEQIQRNIDTVVLKRSPGLKKIRMEDCTK